MQVWVLKSNNGDGYIYGIYDNETAAVSDKESLKNTMVERWNVDTRPMAD